MDSLHESLSNRDLAPVPPSQRTWSMWNITALWIGMAVCIPTYTLATVMIAKGMNWWQATLTVLIGNLIVLLPMILIGHVGPKYGVPFPVFARASFGTQGAHIPAIARALVACGWFGIQTWIGGGALYSILGALGWIDTAADTEVVSWLGITSLQFLCFIAFWLVHVFIILAGIESIKWLEVWAAPFLIACGAALLIWAFVKVTDDASLFSSETHFAEDSGFWWVFWPQLTAVVGFWATLSLNIPDFTRYCRRQKDQVLGQMLGLPPTMTFFCFIGIIVTGATIIVFGEAIWDPIKLVALLGSKTVVVIAMIALLLATLSTNLAANVVSPANGFSNLLPKWIGFRLGGLITALIGIVIMPWRLYSDLQEYIFTWLLGYSALLGPIAGIMLCDYFLLRKTRLDLRGLYDPRGVYRGINWIAVVTLVLSVLPNIPGFINAATNTAGTEDAIFWSFFDRIYAYAWFIGVGLSIPIYWLLMQLTPARAAPAPLDKVEFSAKADTVALN